MQRVLVSACLLGQMVRYQGGGVPFDHPLLAGWLAEGRLVAVCPEVAGGLPTPRPPAEIEAAKGGLLVLRGEAQVLAVTGGNVTAAFIRGAEQARAIILAQGIRLAILKEGSPSCGSGYTYDGSFTGVRVPGGVGVTTACLLEVGVRVFSEAQLDEAAAFLAQLEKKAVI